MTDASTCRQRPAWRAPWLWRWLYMLNDTERMEGKYDWTTFPQGLNIKASPTGNTVNLPRLPPQWGTRSTISKNGPSARGLSKDKHTLGQTKVCTCVSIRARTQTEFCLEYMDCVYSDSSCRPSLSYHCQHFFEISTSKCLSQSSGTVDLRRTDVECLRANIFQLSAYQSGIQPWRSAPCRTDRMKDPTQLNGLPSLKGSCNYS